MYEPHASQIQDAGFELAAPTSSPPFAQSSPLQAREWFTLLACISSSGKVKRTHEVQNIMPLFEVPISAHRWQFQHIHAPHSMFVLHFIHCGGLSFFGQIVVLRPTRESFCTLAFKIVSNGNCSGRLVPSPCSSSNIPQWWTHRYEKVPLWSRSERLHIFAISALGNTD